MNLSVASPEEPFQKPPSCRSAKLRDLYGLDRLLWRGKIGPAFWNIALNQTDLHEPFVGLQDVVLP